MCQQSQEAVIDSVILVITNFEGLHERSKLYILLCLLKIFKSQSLELVLFITIILVNIYLLMKVKVVFIIFGVKLYC